MDGGRLTFDEWCKLSEYEKGERYKELSDKDKFRVRITMPPKSERVPCNECAHYQGFGKCAAFPDIIPKDHMEAVMEDISIMCKGEFHWEEYHGEERIWSLPKEEQ